MALAEDHKEGKRSMESLPPKLQQVIESWEEENKEGS
jgi:hypothetical protein